MTVALLLTGALTLLVLGVCSLAVHGVHEADRRTRSGVGEPFPVPFQPHRSLLQKGPKLMKRRLITVTTACLIILGGLGARVVSGASTPSSAAAVPTNTPTTTAPVGAGRASNARSGPAAGGAVGTIVSVSTPSFTLTTSAGVTVTVHEAPSTKYDKGKTTTSASAVTKGTRVLVLGTTSSGTITATKVILSWQPARTSTAAGVIPFQRGAPTAAKAVGQIPAIYREGSGTIVSGTTANKATKAALAAYPGGVIDRVVKLSNGEYEVHNIGVNWPHHIFVNQQFKVVGAN
jgi:hypothetical protein